MVQFVIVIVLSKLKIFTCVLATKFTVLSLLLTVVDKLFIDINIYTHRLQETFSRWECSPGLNLTNRLRPDMDSCQHRCGFKGKLSPGRVYPDLTKNDLLSHKVTVLKNHRFEIMQHAQSFSLAKLGLPIPKIFNWLLVQMSH